MRKYLILLLVPVLILVFFPAAAAPAATLPTASVVEDFEAYTTDGELESAWPDYDAGPVQTLVATAHGGSKAMQFDYNVTGTPVMSVSHTFATAPDWSGMTRLTLWYQGFADNSADDLLLQLRDSTDAVLFEAGLPGATGTIGWNVWTLDLTQGSPDLSAVDAIVIGVQATIVGSPGSGSVLFDDISVSDGQETIWLGITNEWGLATNWDPSIPDVDMDARIPSVPSGGQMPVLLGPGADVHDLTIEAGATLDLGVHDLTVSGTLYNFGTISQTQSVGANAEVDFLTVGGHPGVRIVTSTPAAGLNKASVDAPGQTSVSIGGRQACTSGNNSVQRCYDITPEVNTILTGGADVTFFFEPGELNGNECLSLGVWHFVTGNWVLVAASDAQNVSHQCAVAPYSLTITGMTDFSPVLLSGAQPVAIGLQAFGAGQQFPFSALALIAGIVALAGLTAVLVMRRRLPAR